MSTFENATVVRRQELTCTEEELETYPDKVLAENEVVYVRMNDGTIRMKMGDGSTRVYDLPFTKVFDGKVVQTTGDSEHDAMSQKAVTDVVKRLSQWNMNASDFWESGSYSQTTGLAVATASRIRTTPYLDKSVKTILANDGYFFFVFAYTSKGAYVGVWDGSSFGTSAKQLAKFDLRNAGDYNFRLAIGRTDNAEVSVDEWENIIFHSEVHEAIAETKDQIRDEASMHNLNHTSLWQSGLYNGITGAYTNDTNYVCTKDYLQKSVVMVDTVGENAHMYAWDKDGAFVGVWNSTNPAKTTFDFVQESANYALNGEIDISKFRALYPDYEFKLMLRTADLNTVGKIVFYNSVTKRLDEESVGIFTEELNDPSRWSFGLFNGITGEESDSATRLKMNDFLVDTVSTIELGSLKAYMAAWDAEGAYVGVWDGNAFVKAGATFNLTGTIDFEAFKAGFKGLKFRLVVVASNLSAADGISFTNKIYNKIGKVVSAIEAVSTDNLNDTSLWESGYYNAKTGEAASSDSYYRTKDYILADVVAIALPTSKYTRLMAWDESGTFVGTWDGSAFGTDGTVEGLRGLVDLSTIKNAYPNCRFKLAVGSSNADYVNNVVFYNSIYKKIRDETANRIPILTFIDDDGHAESLQNWESISDACGIKNTFAMITSTIGNAEGRATWEEVERMLGKGFEFISHSHGHINIVDTDESAVIEDFENSTALLRQHFCNPKYLVYPYNAVPTSAKRNATVKKYFSAAVAGGEVTNVSPMNPYTLHRYSILTEDYVDGTEYYAFKTLDDLKAIIDDAVKNTGWVIMMTHFRNEETMYHFDDTAKQLVIDLCKYAVKQGVQIMPFGKAFERLQNRFAEWYVSVGTDNEGATYVVDSDGIGYGTDV